MSPIVAAAPARPPRRRVHAGAGFALYCLVAMLIALVAMNTGVNLLFWIFGVMAAAIVVGGVVSGSMMLSLGLRRLPTGRLVAGEPAVLRYAVTNRSRLLPAFGVWIEEATGAGAEAGRTAQPRRRAVGPGRSGRMRELDVQPAWIMHVGPGETVHGQAVLRPRRRGLLRLDPVRLASAFPFGLLRKSVTFSVEQELLVLPRTWPLRPGVLRELAPRGATGTRTGRRSGPGDDFFGLRDHRPEDGLRNVAWKRTADRDDLLVIERTRPNPPRLRVALNLTAATDALGVRPDEPVDARGLEERAISLAASIVVAADHLGYEVGLSVLGTGAASIPVRRTARHRDRILAELARIDLDLPRSSRVALPPVEREGAALVVVHPARVEPDIVPAEALHYTARQAERLVEPGTLDDAAAAADPPELPRDASGAADPETARRRGRRHERAGDPPVARAAPPASPGPPAYRVPAAPDRGLGLGRGPGRGPGLGSAPGREPRR